MRFLSLFFCNSRKIFKFATDSNPYPSLWSELGVHLYLTPDSLSAFET